ncbi:MAG TPA: alpha/beta fold hydrolase [Symbiobacteriaceae bacterium]|nr:alpha/beta fold hydrolase [Symbiobacteriaceae bacterium]
MLLAVVLLMALPTYTFADVTGARRYPVIFVPGIGGTELYNHNELVWVNTWRLAGSHLPIFNLLNMNWLLPLRLAADGATPYYNSDQIRTGDIMRHNLTNVYGGMLSSLRTAGYTEGKDLFVLPYDWRLDLAVASAILSDQVDRVLAKTGAAQVVLVSHSMGGLVARDYVVKGGAPRVKATIAMATPWLGSPMAYRALEYGWDMGLKLPGTKWSALAPKDVKLLSQNYPAVYTLAPGRHYWDWYPMGYLTRGGRALNYDETVERALSAHNRSLAQQAPQHQERLLDGNNHGVMQFILAGTGRQTVEAFTETKDWFGFTRKSERFTDGDEVVPLRSADLGLGVNRDAAERLIGRVEAVAYAREGHTFFTGSSEVQDRVKQWLREIEAR